MSTTCKTLLAGVRPPCKRGCKTPCNSRVQKPCKTSCKTVQTPLQKGVHYGPPYPYGCRGPTGAPQPC